MIGPAGPISDLTDKNGRYFISWGKFLDFGSFDFCFSQTDKKVEKPKKLFLISCYVSVLSSESLYFFLGKCPSILFWYYFKILGVKFSIDIAHTTLMPSV
jgi:hypothetical protein